MASLQDHPRCTVPHTFNGGSVQLSLTSLSREGLVGESTDVTGLYGWHAGHLLAELLASRAALVRDTSVLELGCGTGLLGSVCCALGASRVCLTDAAAAVLQQAEANARSAGGAGCRTSVSCAQLEWGDVAAEAALLGRPAAFFNLALAAEVLYHHRQGGGGSIEEQAAALVGCAGRMLAGAAGCTRAGGTGGRACGVLLLCYTPRYSGGMGAAVRRGAESAGATLFTLRRDEVQDASMAASLRFGRTRLAAASQCSGCLKAWMASAALTPGGIDDDDVEECGEWESAQDVLAGVPAVGAEGE